MSSCLMRANVYIPTFILILGEEMMVIENCETVDIKEECMPVDNTISFDHNGTIKGECIY